MKGVQFRRRRVSESPWLGLVVQFSATEKHSAGYASASDLSGWMLTSFKTPLSMGVNEVIALTTIGGANGVGSEGASIRLQLETSSRWSGIRLSYDFVRQNNTNGKYTLIGIHELAPDTWYAAACYMNETTKGCEFWYVSRGGVLIENPTLSVAPITVSYINYYWIERMLQTGTAILQTNGYRVDGIDRFNATFVRQQMQVAGTTKLTPVELEELKTPINHYATDPNLWSWVATAEKLHTPLPANGDLENKFAGTPIPIVGVDGGTTTVAEDVIYGTAPATSGTITFDKKVVFAADSDQTFVGAGGEALKWAGATGHTFSFRVTVRAFTSVVGVLLAKYGSTGGWYIYIDGSEKITFAMRDLGTSGNCTGQGNTALVIDTDYDIIITHDGSRLVSGTKIYFNAVSQTVNSLSNTLISLGGDTAKNEQCTIGNNHLIANLYSWPGDIRRVEVWDTEFSQADVTEYTTLTNTDARTHSKANTLKLCMFPGGGVDDQGGVGNTGRICDHVANPSFNHFSFWNALGTEMRPVMDLSFAFGGTDEYLSCGTTIGTLIDHDTPWTIIIEEKMLSGTGGPFCGNVGTAPYLYLLTTTAERLRFQMAGSTSGSIFFQANDVITPSAWKNIAITCSGNSSVSGFSVYIDGVLSGITTYNDDIVGTGTNNRDFRIAGRGDGAATRQATMHRFRIWNVELTSGEVADPASAVAPIADWRMGNNPLDDATGTTGTIRDEVGGYHATPQNTETADIIVDYPEPALS